MDKFHFEASAMIVCVWELCVFYSFLNNHETEIVSILWCNFEPIKWWKAENQTDNETNLFP